MGGKYEGKDAFDIPQSYIDSFPTWSTTILPGYVTDAMKRRKDFDNKEEWHEWFDSTLVPLGDTVADSVTKYLKETTVDFVIEIEMVLISIQSLLLSKMVLVRNHSNGTYYSMKELRTDKYNWRREWNMLVKLWFYRKLGLPFYITPKLSLSRVGIIGQELQVQIIFGVGYF